MDILLLSHRLTVVLLALFALNGALFANGAPKKARRWRFWSKRS
jgi:hypothetical protein